MARILTLGGCVLVVLGTLACAAAAGATGTPRFSLSHAVAIPGDLVEVRTHFIGTLEPSREARRAFTVPRLEPGSYVLAYWCRHCLPVGTKVAILPSPRLRLRAPAGEGCPATSPNGDAPPGVPRSAWRYHGNGHLAVLVPSSSTVLTTNALGGYKMLWVARQGLFGTFRVDYRMLGSSTPSIDAGTVRGSLGGYDGPSWASRMSFEPGCWQITARVFDVTLSFVAEIVRGDG
jgi:hypothetical protein